MYLKNSKYCEIYIIHFFQSEIDALDKLRAAAIPLQKVNEDPESEEELCET